jgi:UDP-GlcNAc:undecaprenyl-phosphate GlcNAc-1-phosphate transferase
VLVIVAVVVLLCVAAPIAIMRLLVPRLEETAPRVSNYRGRKVFLGLGIVWTIWMIFLLAAQSILELAFGFVPTWLDLIARSAPLVIGACALGMFDDLLGSRDSAKGFKGHFRALAHGQVTTGMLKLIGICLLSFCAAVSLSGELNASLNSVVQIVTKTAVIALCANELNLFDLRPARALKAYLIVLILSALILVVSVGNLVGIISISLAAAISCVPVIAIWRYDARELGLMGDAGSNAMGASLGYFLCCTVPLPGLIVAAIILLFMNLASERVSYSALIEKSRFLKRIDELGRPKEEADRESRR